MSFQLFNTALLAGLELTLNSALKLDMRTLDKMEDISGSVLAVKSTAPESSIFISFHHKSISLSSLFEGNANTTISGSASALIHLLLTPTNKKGFYGEEIHISGDAELIQKVYSIASSLNIDWEYYLSKFIGDIPTQGVSDTLHGAKGFVASTRNSVMMNLDEYIHEEKKLFPTKSELENFYNSIDKLSLRVDRSHARLQNISFTEAGSK